jgi:enoyl-CoA hydratase
MDHRREYARYHRAMSVRYEIEGRTAIITIDRPTRRNAVDRSTADALVDAFTRFDADAELDVAILTGAGNCFCAGADLRAIGEGKPNRIDRAGDGPMGPSRMLLRKPTIAAIEGWAVAGGLELALWCDLRVAAMDARFGVLCRRWGVPLIDGGTVRLPRMIGHSHALDLILTGREVFGEEAARMGLANRLCPPGEALATAKALAASLSEFPQQCMREDRLSSYEQWSLPQDAAIANELEHGLRVLAGPQFLAGVRRFFE